MKSVYKLLIVLSVALLLIFAIFFFSRAQLKASNGGGGAVLSQCTPCHRDLDGFKNPRITFGHAIHFEKGIKCDKCHVEYPHQPTGTLRVGMYLCYNCHGLGHSQQGLVARADCSLCHPKTFNLIPGTHTPAWNSSLHKLVPKSKLKECMLCHKPQFCEQCHSSRGIKPLDPEVYRYEGIFPVPLGSEVLLDRSTPVILSKCNSCHLDIEAFSVPGLIFKHGVHFEKGVRCASCHREFPHSQSGTIRVSMETCYGCHGLRHSKQGLVAKENCELCHPPGFNLVPSTHTREFKASLHKEQALRDRLYCRMCHTEEWCSACHNTRKVVPKDHRAKEVWRERHGKGNKDIAGCMVCHNTILFCDDCHRTTVPHSLVWLGQHAKRAKQESVSCKVCHQERQYCQDCHHSQLGSNILVQRNCDKCHPDYKLPLLLVRGRTHMVHKGHFELTNREPYKCEDCHELRIARATGLQYYAVCYQCHGKYRLGKLIAKWGGYELCYRCHQGAPGGAPMGQQLPGVPLPGPSTPGSGVEQQLSPRR